MRKVKNESDMHFALKCVAKEDLLELGYMVEEEVSVFLKRKHPVVIDIVGYKKDGHNIFVECGDINELENKEKYCRGNKIEMFHYFLTGNFKYGLKVDSRLKIEIGRRKIT